jgi:hypothetical protein
MSLLGVWQRFATNRAIAALNPVKTAQSSDTPRAGSPATSRRAHPRRPPTERKDYYLSVYEAAPLTVRPAMPLRQAPSRPATPPPARRAAFVRLPLSKPRPGALRPARPAPGQATGHARRQDQGPEHPPER